MTTTCTKNRNPHLAAGFHQIREGRCVQDLIYAERDNGNTCSGAFDTSTDFAPDFLTWR